MSAEFEYVLELKGPKQHIACFMKNIKSVDEVVVYKSNDETLQSDYYFGLDQGVNKDSIVFDGNYQIGVADVAEISKLHPTLTLVFKYMNPNHQEIGVLEVKNGECLRDEGDSWQSNFAVELFDLEYICECTMPEACVNTLKLKGPKSDIKNFMDSLVDENILAYKDAAGEEIFLGLINYKKKKKIVFTSEFEAPIDDLTEISKLYPNLKFTLKYIIEDDEIYGLAEIKNGAVLEHEEFDDEDEVA